MKSLSCCILSLLLLTGTAFSQDNNSPTITFRIPVQLQSLHQNVTEVSVQVVCNDQANAPVTITARSATLVPDANGNINQTVTIIATALPGKDIANAKTYSAALGLKFTGVEGYGNPSTASTHIELQPKPGTTFVPQVYGNITW